MTGDIVVRILDLPHTVKGLTTYDDDGTAIICINSRLSRDTQRETYKHELQHVTRDDMDNDLPIGIIEK